MFTTLFISSVFLEAGLVAAFPHLAAQLDKRVAPLVPFPQYPGQPAHALYNSFNAAEQLVSTTGAHRWIAPGPGDIRGPCAGLNAAANHGYIPRNGIATFATINTGLFEMFGLDEAATQVLESATRFFDGDPISGEWSIGYYSPIPQTPGTEILGIETGICDYGHLKTEGDASITRGDFLAPTMNGNCQSYPEFAQQLLDLATNMTGGNITPPVLAQHSYNRKLHSIATNPNYFSPAYAGVAFTFGAHMFAFELLANHSAQYPRGVLTPATFESFFSYTRNKQGKLVYTYGHERIPENWYRRAAADSWGVADIAISTAQQCASYPTNCQVGGNLGKVNSFTGFDLGNLTGGFINTVSDLSDPAKMACFMSQAIQADVPSFLDNVFEGPTLAAALALLPTVLMPALQPLIDLGSCQNVPAGRSIYAYGQNYPGGKIQTSGSRATEH